MALTAGRAGGQPGSSALSTARVTSAREVSGTCGRSAEQSRTSRGFSGLRVGSPTDARDAPLRNGELFYRRLGDDAMMAVAVATSPQLVVGPPKELFRGSGNPGGSTRATYAVAADGQRFLMSADRVASGQGGTGVRPRINIVLNWTEELKRRVPAN